MAAKETKTVQVTHANGVVVSVSEEKAERLLAGNGWTAAKATAKKTATDTDK